MRTDESNSLDWCGPDSTIYQMIPYYENTGNQGGRGIEHGF